MQRGPQQRNVLNRIFDRETTACPPSASVNRVRGFYQSIHPNQTAPRVDCPNVLFSRFTPDGRYLIGLPAGCQQLAVYQYTGLSVCRSHRNQEQDLPPVGFESFFNLKYQVPIVHGTEILSQEFAILLNNGKHLLLASQTPPSAPAERTRLPPDGGPIQPVETTTFHVVDLATGKVLDVLQFHDDFLQLHFHACISVHDNLLAITTLHTQTIHIVQISASGALVLVRSLGRFCHDDDALTLHLHPDSAPSPHPPAPSAPADPPPAAAGPSSAAAAAAQVPLRLPQHRSAATATAAESRGSGGGPGGGGRGGGGGAVGARQGPFVEGLWQRMLAYIFTCSSMGLAVGQPLERTKEQEAGDSSSNGGSAGGSGSGTVHGGAVRAQLGYFYQQFETYRKLFITRAQLLDRVHLLINMSTHLPARGGDAGAGQRNYFLVYNTLSTRVEAFFPDASEDLGRIFLRHHDDFLALAAQTPWERFISTNLPMTRIRDSLARQDPLKNRPLTFRRALLSLPYAPQTRSPSPYLDPLLYVYNEKAMSQFHKTRQTPPSLVKFTPRTRPNHTAFRVTPGPPDPQATHQVAMHYFHPFHPLVLSVFLSPSKPPLMNIHYHMS